MATPLYVDNLVDNAATFTANATSSPYSYPPSIGQDTHTGILLVSVANAPTGTSPTLTFQLQGSLDGVTWYNVGAAIQFSAAGQNSVPFTPLFPMYQIVRTVGGTSPSFTGVTSHLLFSR